MPRAKYSPRPVADAAPVPFDDAAQAWLWYIRCQRARRDGARFESRPRAGSRPCDPDDIFLAVRALYCAGRLTPQHLHALARFGVLDRAPDPRLDDERHQSRLWDEAMDRLGTTLKAKGIVA